MSISFCGFVMYFEAILLEYHKNIKRYSFAIGLAGVRELFSDAYEKIKSKPKLIGHENNKSNTK